MDRTLRVLVVEDHQLMSEALVSLLGGTGRFEVVGVTTGIRQARRLLVELLPQLLLADMALEDGSATELIRFIAREHLRTRVVIVTGYRDPFSANEALLAGAMGYVLKAYPSRDLLQAMDAVAMGKRYVSASIAEQLEADGTQAPGFAKLSPRELEILRMMAQGSSSGEIAKLLCISTKTLDTHRSNMYRKLAVRNAVDLMRYAALNGILGSRRGSEPRRLPH
jgi:DNA-binding NarL/FixJ family response regulator